MLKQQEHSIFGSAVNRVRKSQIAVLLLLLILPVGLAAQDSDGGLKINGYLQFKYETRTTTVSDYEDGSSPKVFNDNDLYGTLRLDATTAGKDSLEFHLLAAGKNDMDGNQDDEGYNPLEGLDDTQPESYGKVYQAHLDANKFLGFKQIRVGRQTDTRGEWIYFDGIAGDLELGKALSFTVYAGKPVHFFETEEGSDSIGGLGIDYLLGTKTKLQFDYLVSNDQRTNRIDFYDEDNNRVEFEDQEDKQITLRWNQLYGNSAHSLVKARWLNDEQRDFELRGAVMDLLSGLDLYLSYYQQSMTEAQLSNETSAFYDVLGIRKPYQSYEIKLSQQFFEDYIIDLGAFQRNLLDAEDESAFNRQFNRSFLIFEVNNLFTRGATLTLTQEQWSSDTYTGSSSGFDAEYRFTDFLKNSVVNLGSYFSLYKYDYYQDLGEQTNVQTFYAQAKVPFWEKYTFTVLYEWEFSKEYDIGTKELFEKGAFTLRRDF